jgi:riboflavin biosynthesis pyrimidine reductase
VIDPNNRIQKEATLLNDGFGTRHLNEDFRGLEAMLDMLGDLEIQRLLVEGGPATINHFLQSDLVDEFILVKSDVVHKNPVLTDFDLTRFSNITHSKWGAESVSTHTR